MLTAERLRELINYDPLTGQFTWKQYRNCVAAGQKAGSVAISGYWTVRVDGKLYRAGRLAFLYMTGAWPTEIDHINGIRDDDRWENLRQATRSQNVTNRSYKNKSGYRGVAFHPLSGLWRAEICLKGARKSLGYFKAPELAHQAYIAAAQELHGEFARTQ